MTEADDKFAQLLKKARTLPKVPGVYLMKDSTGVVIYVGKANVLPNRVSSYFVPSAEHGPKNQLLMNDVVDFDYLECEGEWEALLAENRLIKDLHPKYNVRLTDDRTFPYLVITMKDDFPGVFITREPRNKKYKGAKIFGPFTSVYALRESMKLLQRIFKFRTCTLDIQDADDKRVFFRPCLLYPIDQCTAPCAAKISKEEYMEDIQRLIRFMESKRSVMLREFQKEMEDASKNMDYEKAAVLRDQIKAIEGLAERGSVKSNWQPEIESFYEDPEKGLAALQKALGMNSAIRSIECIDIAHLQGQETVGSKVCFIDGRPFKDAYRRYKIKTHGNDDFGSIREVVSRAYREAGEGNALFPDVILIDGGKGQLSAALEAVADFKIKPPMITSLAKKEELIYQQGSKEPIKLGRNNQGLKVCQAIRDEAHRFAQHYHHILRQKQMLDRK